MDEPNGSATTPPQPFLQELWRDAEHVSAPNQVANTVAVTMYIGSAAAGHGEVREFLTSVPAAQADADGNDPDR
jgi:hypothetical protein